MYDLVMFDLDGTLTDSARGITNCVKYALESFGIEENNYDTLKKFIGPPLVECFMEIYSFSKDDAIKALEKYRERFSDIGIYENDIFDGVEEMLKNIKKSGRKIALATSKPHVYANKILEYFKISEYFDISVGPELNETRNTKEEVIEDVLKLAPDCKNPVMVGDRKHDVLGAIHNNVSFIGVSFGYAEENELKENGAKVILDSIKELEEYILNN